MLRSVLYPVLIAVGLVTGPAPAGAAYGALEDRIRLLTLEAADKQVDALRRDPAVAGIARQHSEAMFRSGRLAHTLDGAGPAERLAREHRSLFGLVAENVAMRRGDLDRSTLARELLEGWMDSPGHRENIFRDYQILEIGCAGDASTVYCTQLFVRQPDRLAEPVKFLQRPQDVVPLELLTGEASVDHRIGIADGGEASGSGVAVVGGQARLELPAEPGTYQLQLWTEVEPDTDRYRIVPGPMLCVASGGAEESVCAER